MELAQADTATAFLYFSFELTLLNQGHSVGVLSPCDVSNEGMHPNPCFWETFFFFCCLIFFHTSLFLLDHSLVRIKIRAWL